MLDFLNEFRKKHFRTLKSKHEHYILANKPLLRKESKNIHKKDCDNY